MEALVHFALGLTGGLFALVFLDLHPRREFLMMFASGLWALIPDGHWVCRGLGLDSIADVWFAFHRSQFADLFWFHWTLDRGETGAPKAELAVALAMLCLSVGVYALFNDWNTA